MSRVDAEVKFEYNGKLMTLYLGNRALRMSERELGFSISKLGENIGIHEMTIMFWACLQKYHPETTIDNVDDMFDELGQEKASELFGKAIEAISSKKNRQQVKKKA